jgi:hypothetical protein
MTTTTPEKRIEWNRFTKDYDLFLGLEFVGSAVNHVDGEKVLDQIIADRKPQPPTPAAQMAALAEQYRQAKANGRLLEAAALRAQAKALEAAHQGVADLVLEGRKVAA